MERIINVNSDILFDDGILQKAELDLLKHYADINIIKNTYLCCNTASELLYDNINTSGRLDLYFLCIKCNHRLSFYSNSNFFNTNLSAKQITLILWSILK
jgi:transcription initiation factor IIE alpha subunit